jgi:hypothetical protein
VRDRALDMGAREADVAPCTRVAFVPAAALLVRRAALGTGFDERLRYGEDVDLVWRLRDRGWRVRYDPRVEVAHGAGQRLTRVARPGAAAAALRLAVQRFHYGTSAAPLALKHPGRLAPAQLPPGPTAILALLAARRPKAAAAAAAVQTILIARRLHKAGVPAKLAPAYTIHGVVGTAKGLAVNPAYLAGVIAGAARHRTLAPLAPTAHPCRR